LKELRWGRGGFFLLIKIYSYYKRTGKGIGREFWLAAVSGLGEEFAVIVQPLVVAPVASFINSKVEKTA